MLFLAAESRSTAGLSFPSLAVSLWNDISGPVFDAVRLVIFKSCSNAFHCPKLLAPSRLLLFSLSRSLHGVVGLIGF